MGSRGSDTTERLHFHFSLPCIGEGNGNPLQCSCLENPRDGGAWWAAVYGVAQSQTRLKQLSSSSKVFAKTTGYLSTLESWCFELSVQILEKKNTDGIPLKCKSLKNLRKKLKIVKQDTGEYSKPLKKKTLSIWLFFQLHVHFLI